jgi:pimeloyl-ACP methyl ester carboxylesterase
MQVVVDSLLTTYHKLGDSNARTVLILHGWGDSSAGWLPLAKQLAQNYQVIALDLPGFGKTDTPTTVWGLDDYAHFVAAFVAKIDVRLDVLIGHSNGGAIAIRGLSHNILQAERLVLLASAGVRSEYKGRKKALRMITKAGKMLASPLPATVKHNLRRKLYTTVGSDMLVAEHLQETFKKVVSDDVQDDAATLQIPTLLIYGENDVSTPPNFGRLLHERIQDSTLEIIGQAEHFLHIDQPKRVQALIEDFLT